MNLLDFIDPGQHDEIAAGAGIYADEAFASAIAHGVSLGTLPTIQLPAGKLKFAQSIHLKHTTRLIGHGGGQATSWGKPATILQFNPGLHGILVHRYNTNADGIESTPTTAADGSIIEGVRLEGSGTVGHGIWLRARAEIRRCQINGFGANGVHIAADSRTTDPFVIGNANNWLLDTLRITNCKGHGVYLDGGDVNAGIGTMIDATSNGGWGIFDSSFLGNTWIGCHTAANKGGAYKTDNPNARSVFLGCYSEGGQPKSEFSHTTVILGGLHGAGGAGGQWIGDGSLSPFKVKGVNAARAVTYRLGTHDSSGLDVIAQGDHSHGWSFGYWHETSKTVQFRHARVDGRVPLSLTTDLSTALDEAGAPVGPGQMLMPHVWAPNGNGRWRKIALFDLVKRIEALEAA